jgi:hypothetical protein
MEMAATGHVGSDNEKELDVKKIVVLFLVIALVVGCASLAGGFWRQVEVGGPVPTGEPTARPAGEGWVDLLDAAHAGTWKNITDGNKIFEVSDGVLHIFGSPSRPLRYVGYGDESFGDFELHLEYKVAKRGNSGLFVRTQGKKTLERGFEIQVQDDHGEPPNRNVSGAIYDVVTPMFNMSRPAGEWNSFDVRVQGREVEVFMNGWRVIHTDLAKMTMPIGKFDHAYADLPLEGLLAFQDHYSEAWYRNVMVRRL